MIDSNWHGTIKLKGTHTFALCAAWWRYSLVPLKVNWWRFITSFFENEICYRKIVENVKVAYHMVHDFVYKIHSRWTIQNSVNNLKLYVRKWVKHWKYSIILQKTLHHNCWRSRWGSMGIFGQFTFLQNIKFNFSTIIYHLNFLKPFIQNFHNIINIHCIFITECKIVQN